jgi:hypothetical protein
MVSEMFNLQYRFIIASLISLLFLCRVHAQDVATLNDNTGSWDDTDTWVGGTQPNPLYTDIGGQNITIEGYVNVGEYGITQDLSFAVNNSGYDLVIEDTLVIYGDLEFKQNSMNLVVNGYLIVFGDVIFRNNVDVLTNGEIIVDGSLSFLGTQGSYSGDGNVYANIINDTGGGEGNIPDDNEMDITNDLQNDYPDIYDFVVDEGESPLPVMVLYFTAARQNKGVYLSWGTTLEENFDCFTLERSSDGKNFHVIARIFSKTTFSGTKKEYGFYDELPLPGYSFYRLKTTDLDGRSDYHGIISIRMDEPDERFRIYPNPSEGKQVNLLFSGVDSSWYQLISFAGKIIQAGALTQGANQLHFIHPLSPGLYFIRVGEGQGTEIFKLIIR